MSEKTRQHLSHDVIFHGSKSFNNESLQITGLNKIGYIQIKPVSGDFFVGGTGVGGDGYPLGDESIIMTAADLSKIYASGNGQLNFIGGYSN